MARTDGPRRTRPLADHAARGSLLAVLIGSSLADAPPARAASPSSGLHGVVIAAAPATDYYGVPNHANSPRPVVNADGSLSGGLRKFVEALPRLGCAPNATGCLPEAVVETWSDGNSDYYEIALVEYQQVLHRDLPPTTLRGYVQIETPGIARAAALDATLSDHYPLAQLDGTAITQDGAQLYAVHRPTYLGPVIRAQRERAVRIKFLNKLPVGEGGKLFLPVDATVTGAGTGEFGGTETYTQNRATLHLHGGNTPWISDGTAHQWITPAEESTSYRRGVSVQNVPDMPDPGPGAQTFFYSNQQSARLMFVHDRSYGITRLNVYAGEAAPYLLEDPHERALVALGAIPQEQIPLVVQDRTFVPDPAQLAAQDPTWGAVVPALAQAKGSLWFPHVYMPNQWPDNPDGSGANRFGRWDYGPWFWPPWPVHYPPVPNPLSGTVAGQGLENPGTPNPSIVPEAFGDTPLVNGVAYPTLSVQRKAYRFRVLNASNDRFLNLQLYRAEPLSVAVTSGGSGYSAPPLVSFAGGGGTGAEADAILASGSVTSVLLLSPGSGYGSPIVEFSGGGGSGAWARATAVNGSIVAVDLLDGGSGYVSAPAVGISDVAGTGSGALAMATVGTSGRVEAIRIKQYGSGYTSAPTVTITPAPGDFTGAGASAVAAVHSEVKMVPAVPGTGLPAGPAPIPVWPTDLREGGVPDPATAGPPLIQIGNEGGFLPAPAIIPAQPINYNYNRRDIVVLNVQEKALFLGPGERADVIVDFSGIPDGASLILYNDAPAPVPALDPRYDYYTGNPDQTADGGAPTTLPGYGPNTRTLARFEVQGAAQPPYALDLLAAALPGTFRLGQQTPIVGETAYGDPIPPSGNPPRQGQYVGVQDWSFSYWPSGTSLSLPKLVAVLQAKSIGELFDPYGRAMAQLGIEIPNTSFLNQTTVPYLFIDPPTEILADGEVQLWKVTHNGVQTHAVHVDGFDAQLVNRVGWDGAIRPPDANELGWKETVRLNPLEDAILALRPRLPTVPFPLPNSVRRLDPTKPVGANPTLDAGGFTDVDPQGQPVDVTNQPTNFGFEYAWGATLLGHEENDMMRPIAMAVTPQPPVLSGAFSGTGGGRVVALSWQNRARNVTGLRVQRAEDLGFTRNVTYLGPTLSPSTTTYRDNIGTSPTTFYYRIVAQNVVGSGAGAFPRRTLSSTSNMVGTPLIAPSGPTGLVASSLPGPSVQLRWVDNATNETGFVVDRAVVGNPLAPITRLASANPGNTGGVTYADPTVAAGTTYQYRVAATNAYGTTYGPPIAVTTAPQAPTIASAGATRVIGGERIGLKWGDVVGEASYRVQWAADSTFTNIAGSASLGAGTTTYTTPTIAVRTWYVRVLAANSGGASASAPVMVPAP